jgi:hypothetical protein
MATQFPIHVFILVEKKCKQAECLLLFPTLLFYLLLPECTHFIPGVCFPENAEGFLVSGLCTADFLRLTPLLVRRMLGIPM